MANFLAVLDPDPDRRTACLRKAADLLHILPTLRRDGCSSDRFAAVWSAAESAPVSVAADARGAGVVWGDALAADGTPTDAAALRRSWHDVARRTPEPWDGFYAAVTYDAEAGLVAGADLFGLFPVYYWSAGDVVLVGSSISAFHGHVAFQSRFNPVGLAGILLTGASLEGETMWTGVRRLAPGHLLTWSPRSGPREVRQYSFPAVETLGNRSFDEHVAMLDEVLDGAIARHVRPDDQIGLLLSGGRDARVVAGLLHRRGLRARALTLGERHDYEVLGATPVAKTLRFPHSVVPDSTDDLEAEVRRHVWQEQLTNGMSNVYAWGMVPFLPPIGRHTLSGYLVETCIGGTARALPGAPSGNVDPVERVLQKATSYGIEPARLRRLLPRQVFGDAVDACLDRMRAAYASLDTDADRRAWHFNIHHRARFHAGSTPWRMSLGTWPVMLPLDQALLRLCTSLPMATVLDRRAEDELLRTRFPALARLPLDRDSSNTEPLLPPATWRLRRFLRERIPLADRMQRFREARLGERRRYHRLFDINAPRWRALRRIAESGRSRAAEVLDARELDALLPPPNVSVDPPYPIAGSNGLKSLLGFLIWLRENG